VKSSGLHRAGAKWRTFAVLYRGHAHRDKLVEVLKGAQDSVRHQESLDPFASPGPGRHLPIFA